MKILMINSLDITYGSTHRMRKFYEFLNEEHKVKYIESNYKGNDKNIISITQPINYLGFFWGTLKRMYFSLILDYDILFFQKFLPFTLPCAIIAKIKKKKVIVDCDDLDSALQKNFFHKIIIYLFERIGWRFTDIIFTHNHYLFNYLKKLGAKNIHIIPQGVDTELFDPKRYNGEKIRKNMKLNDKIVLIYSAGFSIGGIADLDVIIEAMKIVNKSIPNFYLLVIGGGPLLEKCKSKVKNMKNIGFTGFLDQEELCNYLSAADIGLVYMRDNLGNRMRVSLKLLEYLSMEKIVVGHLMGESKDVFGRYCILSEPSVESFAEKIIWTIKNKINYFPNVRNFIQQNYDWQKIREKVIHILKSV